MYEIIGIVLLVVILFTQVIILKNKGTNNTLTIKDVKEINERMYEKVNEKLNSQTNLFEEKNKSLFDKISVQIASLQKQISLNNKDINDKLELITTSQKEFFANFFKDNKEVTDKMIEKLSAEIKEFNKQVTETLNNFSKNMKDTIKEFNDRSDKSFEKLEKTVKDNLTEIRTDNNKKLEEINVTVGEKLEKTLEGRLKQSFDNVIEQIGGVNKAIGEIKGLASDVGSLKTVLTNVKTKGIVGEVILGNIIKEILTTGQYEENVATKINSNERVEFAIKMPGVNDDEYVYLPIDSKLPLESYHKIKEGLDVGNADLIKEGRSELRNSIRKYAKDINTKYIDVPNTTDFAIMFLPIEGLYIEALNLGLFEEIQREYKVNIAGPTTLTAILNALQMGFKTLIIQKKSADVFKLLAAVKKEFNKFAETLEKTQKKVGEASDELDKLVGTRTRKIQSKLKNIASISDEEATLLLEDELDERNIN